MAQVDSEHSIAMPARPAGGVNSQRACSMRQREKAFRRLAKLRKKAPDEIERLLAFLDASDPYAATELEAQADDGACDDDELEPSLGGVTACDGDPRGTDLEDDVEKEPSLGSLDNVDQSRWSQSSRSDLEQDAGDEAEPAFCGLTVDRACHVVGVAS